MFSARSRLHLGGVSPRPSLTVALAVWDRYVAYLPVALEEAARQGVPAKLLILDNASEVPVPGASELRSMLGAEQRDVLDISVWRSQRRLTIGAARQAQVDQTETSHIVFHDADDLLLPGVWASFSSASNADRSLPAPPREI